MEAGIRSMVNQIPLEIEKLPFETSLNDWRMKKGHRTYISPEYKELHYDDSNWMKVPVGITFSK